MNSHWILEDTADFIAGRAVAAMTRYRQQLLPPLFSALMKYSDIHEYSRAAPVPGRRWFYQNTRRTFLP